MMLAGGCQCGHIRYELDAESILTLYCCHCQECQRQSASAFAMSMKVQRGGFALTTGTLTQWQRRTDCGGINRAHFCGACGCRIYHDAGNDSAMVSLKAGSLDEAARFRPIGHIWTSRAQPWVVFHPGAVLFDGQPDTYDSLIVAWHQSNSTQAAPR